MNALIKQRFFYRVTTWLIAFFITSLGILLVSPTQAAAWKNIASTHSVNFTPSLSGSISDGAVVKNHDLSNEGHEDWAIWGQGTNTSLTPDVRKSGGSAISDLTNLTNGTPLRGLGQFGDFSHTFLWSDGTPTLEATNQPPGIQHDSNNLSLIVGEGFGFTLPADPIVRRARIYVGTHNGQSKVVASLSDASAPNYIAFQTGISGNRPAIIELIYSAATAGQTLDMKWTLSQAGDYASNAQLFAVTVTKDSDSDTVFDDTDNCPDDANTDQVNTDSDSQGNACDTDDDNDGVLDTNDTFPLDVTESVDTDHDGIGNNADTDDDDDGVADANDAFPLDVSESVDTDHDGIGNNADADDDNDGIGDTTEAANGTNPLDNDSDGDLVPDSTDSAPTQKPTLIAHQTQINSQTVVAAVNAADVELNLHGQSSFVVPVVFTPNGPNIASVDFVLDYDESCLTFATAGNNGIPTAVTGLPASHVTTVQADTAAGKLTFLIHPPSNSPPLPLLNNVGTLAQITFGVRNECVTTNGDTQTVAFSFPDVDYGYADGNSLPNQTGQTSTYLLRFNAAPTLITLVDAPNGSTADNTIDENAAAGAVVAYLNSTDLDESAPRPGDSHSYSMVSGPGSDDNNRFTLSNDQLQAALSFDFEVKNSYSLRLRATDQYGLSVEQQITVLVNDLNEAPTAIDLVDNTVAEEVAGAGVGQLSTDDQDLVNPGGVGDILEAHSYSLPAGQADNDLFEIVGTTLQFKAGNSANFEVKNSYSVAVRSSDSANQTFEQTFALVVLDSDDNPVAKDDGVTPPLVVIGGRSTVIDVLANDSDEDGDLLSIIAVGNPTLSGASTAFNPASVSYNAPNQNGQDNFTYTISDGSVPTVDGNVTVQVVKEDPRGDCNSDGAVNAADFPALVLEYFDNDTLNWWDIFPNGFHGSPLGCDANANGPTNLEVSGGAGDIICTVLIFFNRGCLTPTVVVAANPALANASLAVSAGLRAAPGKSVAVPLQLASGGNNIAAATFALDFDTAHFTFDATDGNDDGLPDALSLNVPASMVKSVTYNSSLSRVEVAVFGASLPLPTIKEGVVATVTLQVQPQITVTTAPLTLDLVSLGNDSGQAVAVQVTNGTVEIEGVLTAQGNMIYLPTIQK